MAWPAIVSAIASVIALIISGFALFQTRQNRKQTKKLFEEARKPYVIAYIQSQQIKKSLFWNLVIKNFGGTGTYITSVEANPSLSGEYIPLKNNPFSAMDHQLIAPGQSYKATIAVSENNTRNRNLPDKIKSLIVEGHSVDKINLSTTAFKLKIDLKDFDGTTHSETFDLDIGSALSLVTFFND